MAQEKWSDADQEKLFWYLATAYLADVVGLLDKTKAAKLSTFESTGGPQTWQESVSSNLAITDSFVKKVFALCQKCGRSELQSVAFILGGLGCTEVEERLKEVLG